MSSVSNSKSDPRKKSLPVISGPKVSAMSSIYLRLSRVNTTENSILRVFASQNNTLWLHCFSETSRWGSQGCLQTVNEECKALDGIFSCTLSHTVNHKRRHYQYSAVRCFHLVFHSMEMIQISRAQSTEMASMLTWWFDNCESKQGEGKKHRKKNYDWGKCHSFAKIVRVMCAPSFYRTAHRHVSTAVVW